MDLPIRLVQGRNTIRGHDGRWIQGQCWLVVLAEHPYRIIKVPAFAIRGPIQAGDSDVILDLNDCGWTREWFNEEWRRSMAESNSPA